MEISQLRHNKKENENDRVTEREVDDTPTSPPLSSVATENGKFIHK